MSTTIEQPSFFKRYGLAMALLALVAIALMLAIGFFYLTEHRRNDRRADAVTGAAQSVDDAARVMEEAARNAADRLRK